VNVFGYGMLIIHPELRIAIHEYSSFPKRKSLAETSSQHLYLYPLNKHIPRIATSEVSNRFIEFENIWVNWILDEKHQVQ